VRRFFACRSSPSHRKPIRLCPRLLRPVPDDVLGAQELRSVSAQLVEWVRAKKPTIRELYLRSGPCRWLTIGNFADPE
jgi:hypothetical protein